MNIQCTKNESYASGLQYNDWFFHAFGFLVSVQQQSRLKTMAFYAALIPISNPYFALLTCAVFLGSYSLKLLGRGALQLHLS